jgi:methionine-rich copper-binding protein CopC
VRRADSIRILLFVAASFFFFTRAVDAHAVLVKATPAPYQLVDGPDVHIRLQFNSRIDAKRSRLSIISSSGEDRTIQISGASTPDCVDSKITGMAVGVYLLRWQVLAADGHISRGQVPFKVRKK